MPERSTPGDDDWSAPSTWGGAESPGSSAGPGPRSNPWEPAGPPSAGPPAGAPWGAPAGNPARSPTANPAANPTASPPWGGSSAGPPLGGPPAGPGWGGPAAPGPSWSGGGGASTLPAPAAAGSPIGPPTLVLIVGLVLPLAALGLSVIGTLTTNIVGWALAVFGSVIPLAVFTRIDLRRRLSRWYVDRRGLLAGLRIAVRVVGLLVAGWFAYLIADEVARWEIWFR